MFYLILICIIGSSYISYKLRDKRFYYISILLTFFLFAFEYDTSNDYWVYVSRFYVANKDMNHLFIRWFIEDEKIEIIYKYIMILCKPIGFFGFNILLGTLEIYTLNKLIKKCIPIKYLWFFYTIFMLIPLYGLLILNSKRQALAIVFILLGVLILNNEQEKFCHSKKLNIKTILLFLGFIIIAGNIHFSAFIGILYLLFSLFKPNQLNKNTIIFIILLFIFSYQIKIDIQLLLPFLNSETKFSQYLTEIGSSYNISAIYFLYDLFSLILVLFYYNKFNNLEKTFSLAYITSIISSHFLIYTASRLMLPFSILTPFVQTYTLKYIQKKNVKLIFIIYSLTIAFRWLYNTMSTESYYSNWNDMQTIFSAPYWL